MPSATLRVVRPRRTPEDAERPGRHSHAERGNELTHSWKTGYGDTIPAAPTRDDFPKRTRRYAGGSASTLPSTNAAREFPETNPTVCRGNWVGTATHCAPR